MKLRQDRDKDRDLKRLKDLRQDRAGIIVRYALCTINKHPIIARK